MSDRHPAASHLETLDNAFEFVQRQCRAIVANHPDLHPMYTVGGSWKHEGESWTHWCEGFYPGIFWLVHSRSRDPWFREVAEQYTRRLEPRRFDRNVHDLGFLFLNTYLRWFRETGDPALEEIVIEAGRTLALRFKEKGQYLCSFIGPESLFVDIMMNVPIIYHAAERTGDESLRAIADQHCATSARYLVHADGSCIHEGIFDTQTGDFLRESTHQGYAPSSCWSRGLAWALHGFGRVYSYTRNPAHLEVAERVAGYYLDHTPGGAIPLWDFDVPANHPAAMLLDSSAAAIAASGLWSLALLTSSEERREAYRQRAIETVVRLSSQEFLADGKPGQEGLLLHGVYHYPKGLGVDESVSWGDHFYVEALVKILTNSTEPAI